MAVRNDEGHCLRLAGARLRFLDEVGPYVFPFGLALSEHDPVVAGVQVYYCEKIFVSFGCGRCDGSFGVGGESLQYALCCAG